MKNLAYILHLFIFTFILSNCSEKTNISPKEDSSELFHVNYVYKHNIYKVNFSLKDSIAISDKNSKFVDSIINTENSIILIRDLNKDTIFLFSDKPDFDAFTAFNNKNNIINASRESSELNCGLYFYTNANYNGEMSAISNQNEVSNLASYPGYNDAISSFRVGYKGGYLTNLTLYWDANFSGRSIIFSTSSNLTCLYEPNLSNWRIYLSPFATTNWNDKVSSFKYY